MLHLTKLLAFCLGIAITSVCAAPPISESYTFPDEWESHQATLMIFPAKHSYGAKTSKLWKEFSAIARAISKNEPVWVFCHYDDQFSCQALLKHEENIKIHVGNFPIDWARDNAPMVIRSKSGKLASAGFQNNGWGMKYPQWKQDSHTRNTISKALDIPIFHSDLVLEGGSIEIAHGIGIVTESCVLNPNRTDWSKSQVESEFKAMLGLHTIIWIESGLMPDKITDGHVDGLLKFISKDTVLLHTTDLKSDPNYTICQQAKKTLLKHGLKVVELPLMDDIVHMNFYIGSGGNTAYVPICGDPEQDKPALKIIKRHFEKVVPILANHMAKAGGGIHCYTQQLPTTHHAKTK